jgi:hypothetical protein
METINVTLKVLNPRGTEPEVSQSPLSSQLNDLKGKRIGILNNTKSGGNELLPYVQEDLKRRIPDLEMREWNVPFMLSPDSKAPRLKEIAEYSDAVVALMAD